MRIIRSIAELREAASDPFLNGFGARSAVRVLIPGAPPGDQARLQKRLNTYQARCGCVSAAVCLVAALSVSAFHIANANLAILSLAFVGRIAMLFFGSVALSLAGKLIALQVTRVQFAHACTQFAGAISAT